MQIPQFFYWAQTLFRADKKSTYNLGQQYSKMPVFDTIL